MVPFPTFPRAISSLVHLEQRVLQPWPFRVPPACTGPAARPTEYGKRRERQACRPELGGESGREGGLGRAVTGVSESPVWAGAVGTGQ